MANQTPIPCILMRGGTSKGPFFYAGDLPTDERKRDEVLLALMGSPHRRQIDGLGGGHALTSKVGIVDRHDGPQADLTFLFAQLQDRKSTRLNSSHVAISYDVFCLKKKTNLT